MGTRWTDERGFTMLEVLIGMLITLTIVAAGFATLTGTQKAAAINDQATQMQQNARLAMDLLANDVKMAGFGMTGAIGNCATAIVPQDNTPTGADTGPDQVSLVVPTVVSTLRIQAAPPFTTITLQNGDVALVTPSGFGNGSPISIGGITATTVSSYSGDVLTIPNVPAPTVYPVGTQVFWLQCITYAIGTTTTRCGGSAPCLLRGVRDLTVPNVNNDTNMVPIVEGIEDIQLAYACDGCSSSTATPIVFNNGTVPNGVPDDCNGSNSFDTADFMSNNTVGTCTMTPNTIRLVQINVVARQSKADQGFGEGGQAAMGTAAPIVVGDHNPSSDAGFVMATYQAFRRRVLTRTVEVRNVGLTS